MLGLLTQKRHTHHARPRQGRESHLETGVAGVHVVLPVWVSSDVAGEAQGSHLSHGVGVADIKARYQRPVDPHVDHLGRREPDDVVGEVPVQPNADRVLPVHWKVVSNSQTTSRPE